MLYPLGVVALFLWTLALPVIATVDNGVVSFDHNIAPRGTLSPSPDVLSATFAVMLAIG